jgi:type I restriction enzyme S subunit
VLFAKITPCMENGKGVHAVGLTNGIGFGSTEFHVLRAKGPTSARYLFHWLQAKHTRSQAAAFLDGSAGQQRVQPEFFRHFRVHRLSADEQARVADILDTVDDAITKTEAMLAKFRRLRVGMVHDLLTCGVDESGQLRDPIAHPELFRESPVGRIPRKWKESSLGAVLQGIDAGQSPDCPDSPAPPGEWGVMKVSALSRDGFRPYENKWVIDARWQNPAYQVADGDLLISRSNTYELVGLVCLVESPPPRLMLSDKTLRLRLAPDRALSPFFCALLQTQAIRQQIQVNATGTSSSMKNISQEVIRRLRLAYPDVDEQRRILAALRPVNREVDRLQLELQKLSALKSGLATDLLTGRVPVDR